MVAGPARIALATTVGAALLVGYGLIGLSGGAAAAAGNREGAKISLKHTSHGKVLVGVNGHSLYTFSSDTKNHSHCTGTCAAHWIPAMTGGKPKAGSGVSATHLGKTSKGQATYYGHPLYTYVKDKKAGQTKGEGAFASGGYWYLTSAKGGIV
jgi:predicted lipoprotein with Yx(FWY)xxD motif